MTSDNHCASPTSAFRLLVTGGGTGGHTYPALTAVRTLQARLAAQGGVLEVMWVGKADSLESRVAAAEGIPFAAVATGKIRRSRNPLKLISPANVADMSRVPLGILQARRVISGFRPDVVLATGGYVAVPVGVAATRLCHVPLVVHEQTVRLGLANKTLAGAATRVAVSSDSTLSLLPEAVRSATVVTGNPVRPEVFTGDADKAIDALSLHGFGRRLPTVYVTGGAQGSQQINEAVSAILPWLLDHANVIHQCGPDNVEGLSRRVSRLPAQAAARYHLTGYVGSELPDVMALADVVISRSGAGTIAELTALGKASVLIPLATSAGNEQAHNAGQLEEAGAAVTVLGDVTSDRLHEAVAPLLTDPARRVAMAERARAYGKPDAADRLVDVILSAASG
ncbi:UDP-N-acetylglucosamine--N-acetylmuramyl-(pentapeptide) pyrophosphoryl-undecaprenol N-acetylglucosamine transferase [Streptomyces sp. Pv4-95]|uniref:UDP-N-acetylglucosamine--N-acetylmuramyl- (pentapeptide) pyrophosphoryl-undecaprenol N-acetylglucosamine transferase n=1 Tax=Streptomyces sp. Pv4-95 TaxID=3049543 RepID=UPI0038916F1C